MTQTGWKVVLSPRVPKLASSIVPSTFSSLLSSVSSLPSQYSEASAFDWALHPGGATILSGVERTMSISSEHIRASYDVYMNHGNSSSATIFSVLDRLRDKDMDSLAPSGENGSGGVKEFVVACAFGPGISIEMGMLRRNLRHVKRSLIIGGEITPPETESEGSRSDGEGEAEDVGEKVKENGDHLNQKLKSVEQEVPEQNDSLSEALNGVELD
jgi:type III polyketide synthase